MPGDPNPDTLSNNLVVDNELYRLALDQLSNIVVTDHHGIITYANENFCRISQYTLPELIGQPYGIISAGYYPDVFFERIIAVIMAGQTWRGEIKSKAKDGSYFWLDVSIFSLKAPDGSITGHFSSCLDITDRKESEEEIIRQVTETYQVVENNLDGLLSVNSNWQIIHVNKTFEETIGLGRTQIISQNFYQTFLAETNAQEAMATLQQAMLDQKPARFEFYYAVLQSWLEVNAFPAGEGLVLTFRNITEKKAVAEQIQASEQRLHAILQSTSDAFFLLAPDMRIITYNERARKGIQRFYNYELKEGDDIRQFGFDDETQHFTDSFTKALQGETVQVERKYQLNGHIMWYWLTYYPVYDTNRKLMGVALNSTDINSLKYFEAEILRANERFSLVAKATNDAIYDWNMELNEIKWYEAFYQLFGYTEQEVASSLNWWYNNVHPDDQHLTMISLNEAIEQKRANWAAEYRFRCGDGSYKLVYERGYILYSETGSPTRMIGALQDMQKLKENESKITAQDEQLRKIAFSQSHEVRRPLANILGLLKCLRKDDLSPDNQEILSMLEQTSAELDVVIRKIIDKASEA